MRDEIMKRLVVAAITTAFASACFHQVEAKPLSYVGGLMLMQENDETGYTFSFDYTFTPANAFGYSLVFSSALGSSPGL